MRRIIGLILLTAYAVWLAICTAVFLLAGDRDAMAGVPLGLATLPWSLSMVLPALFHLELSKPLGQAFALLVLAIGAAINISLILFLGGLGPFAKRHQTGTKES